MLSPPSSARRSTSGRILDLCQKKRGKQITLRYIDTKTVILKYEIPLAEIIVGFYDSLKSVSKGYASFDYEHIGTRLGDLVKLEIMINAEVVDAFSVIVHEEKAQTTAHFLAEKLKAIIPRQMFEVPIQARIRNKIIARENIAADEERRSCQVLRRRHHAQKKTSRKAERRQKTDEAVRPR